MGFSKNLAQGIISKAQSFINKAKNIFSKKGESLKEKIEQKESVFKTKTTELQPQIFKNFDEFIVQKIKQSKYIFPAPQLTDLFIEKYKEAAQNKKQQFEFMGLKYNMPFEQALYFKPFGKDLDQPLLHYLYKHYSQDKNKIKTDVAKEKVFINGTLLLKKDLEDYKIQSLDKIKIIAENIIEPPTYNINIDFEKLDGHLLQINKPPSISCDKKDEFPISTVVKLIKEIDPIMKQIQIIEYLPRQYSGLVLATNKIFKSYQDKLEYFNFFYDNCVQKKYFARVYGQFHNSKIIQIYYPKKEKYEIITQDQVEDHLSQKHKFQDKFQYKPLITELELLSYDPITNTSLVDCKLYSGPASHIQNSFKELGFPLLNDSAADNFFGNFYLNQNLKEYMGKGQIKQFNQKILELKKQEERANRNIKKIIRLGDQNIGAWTMFNTFEVYIHAYHYQYQIPGKEKKTSFELETKPYWYDSKILQN